AVGSGVLIRGGTFRTGTRAGLGLPLSVDASNSNVVITDGSFDGIVQLSSSTAEISGGSFSIGLALGKSDPGTIPFGPGCTDVGGGGFSFGLDVRGVGEQVFLFGSRFDRGFGPLPIPLPPASRQQFVITGTRLDGSALRLDVIADAGTR